MSPLNLEVRDYVATITIDNPPVNVWDLEFMVTLMEYMDSFEDRTDVRCAIITGAGDRAFTAGHNVKRGRAPEFIGPQEVRRMTRDYSESIMACRIPVIAAVNGFALGHGVVIASSCDFVIASENASFGLPEINIGALGGGTHFMRLFPPGHARYALYTAERWSAQDAFRLGAVLEVVPPSELMPRTMEYARKIAEKSPIGIRNAKESLYWGQKLDTLLGYRFEQVRTRAFGASTEAAEARAAWREKRRPVFGD